jgi:hypothetical protein
MAEIGASDPSFAETRPDDRVAPITAIGPASIELVKPTPKRTLCLSPGRVGDAINKLSIPPPESRVDRAPGRGSKQEALMQIIKEKLIGLAGGNFSNAQGLKGDTAGEIVGVQRADR